MMEEMDVLNRIEAKINKMDKSLAIVRTNLENQKELMNGQALHCKEAMLAVDKKIDERVEALEKADQENAKFSNYSKGAVAGVGVISLILALMMISSYLKGG